MRLPRYEPLEVALRSVISWVGGNKREAFVAGFFSISKWLFEQAHSHLLIEKATRRCE